MSTEWEARGAEVEHDAQSESEVPSEGKIVFESTMEAISHTRRILFFISGLLCLGLFHTYIWYLSWEVGRVEGRRAVASALRHPAPGANANYLGSAKADVDFAAEQERQADEIEREIARVHYKVPLVGLDVNVADFPPMILMLAVASLLWLYFYHKRLNSCLERLAAERGWGAIETALRFKFVLLSGQESGMKFVARLLPASLGVMSLGFMASDASDFYGFYKDSIKTLAFREPSFVGHVCARIGTDFFLAAMVIVLSYLCYREFRRTEDRLLP